jgi:glycine reductase
VAYYCLIYSPQYDHHGKSEPFFYGGELPSTLPTLVHPNELLDGGIVGYFPMKGLDTYSIQNHGVITELYARHGKDLLFAGMLLAVAHENPIHRDRRAMVAAGIIKNTLHADGVILTKVHGGMMHMDLATVAEACEKAGVRTVPFHQGVAAQGTLSDHALFNSPLLNSVVYLGVTVENCPLMPEPVRFLGGPPDARRHSPTGAPRRSNDKDLTSEEYLLAGVHDHTGGAYVRAAKY